MALIQRTICHISQSIKSLLVVILCMSTLIVIPQAHAEPQTYGPTKSGDTLWNIAKKNLPDPSLSIEQFVYSIYLSNPAAFQSGNINQLAKGVTVKLPVTASIIKISKPEAKKQVKILQKEAEQLTRAKANSKKFNRQIAKYNRQLRKYRRNTRAWKRIYRKLARSKRNRTVSNRKIALINKSIRDRQNVGLASFPKIKEENASTTEAILDLTKPTLLAPVVMTETPQKTANETNNNLQVVSLKQNDLASKAESNPINEPDNLQIKSAETTKLASVTDKQKPIIESKQETNWFNYISENFILIAGIINSIILLFVLVKLFEKKEEPDFLPE